MILRHTAKNKNATLERLEIKSNPPTDQPANRPPDYCHLRKIIQTGLALLLLLLTAACLPNEDLLLALEEAAQSPAAGQTASHQANYLAEAIQYVPPGALEIRFTDWSFIKAQANLPAEISQLSADERLGLWEDTLAARGYDVNDIAFRAISPVFFETWGWNAFDLEWAMALTLKGGSSVRLAKLRPDYDLAILMERYLAYGFEQQDLQGAILFSGDWRGAEWAQKTFNFDQATTAILLQEQIIVFALNPSTVYDVLDFMTPTGPADADSIDLSPAIESAIDEVLTALVENPADDIRSKIQAHLLHRLAEVNEVDEERQAKLLAQAVFDILTFQAARDVADQMSKIDTLVSAIFFLDPFVCTQFGSPVNLFLDNLDADPATVKTEIEEQMKTLESIVPAHPYFILGAGLTPDEESPEEAISVVVMHYLDQALAQADLEIRRQAAATEIPLGEDETPYSERFTVEDAQVTGNNLVLWLRQHRAVGDVYHMIITRDLLFGACPARIASE